MKNKIFIVAILAVMIVFFIGLNSNVEANSINSINMDIYIDKNGNAEVTETWICYANSGTEIYHPYYNLGASEIYNLRVSDKSNTYTALDNWDTSASMNEKAYKCGINYVNNGLELCWGISKYGSNVYTAKYNISGFVANLTDSQMSYWTLIPKSFSNEIGSVKIRIYSDEKFSDSLDVWGYGNYGGLCYVNNGSIYMDSDGQLDTDEYMTILVKFPSGMYNTSNDLSNSFEYYYNMAEEGSTAYNDNTNSLSSIGALIAGIIKFIMEFLPLIVIFIAGIFTSKSKKFGFKYGALGKKIPRDVAYYRDIPCNGDVFKAYYIGYQYNLLKNKTDILGAIILKWLKLGIIRTENREGGRIFKREDTVIILGDEQGKKFDNIRETQLFHMMYVASKDGILENKEFERWCKNSYEKILGWFDKILEEEREKLVAEGIIKYEAGGVWGKNYVATAEIKNEAMSIAGLKRYLLDYTLIKDREAIEVTLFEDYLIFAQMMGIADKVEKQFKELYPDMIEQTHYGSYDNLIYINYCTTRGISSANSARAAAQSYSGGGGGFSSGGGGGGSFGGGGGRRRFPLK